jgi:hypothetical protein
MIHKSREESGVNESIRNTKKMSSHRKLDIIKRRDRFRGQILLSQDRINMKSLISTFICFIITGCNSMQPSRLLLRVGNARYTSPVVTMTQADESA